jgi:HTH-type transcriptional regulator / antitoxin HigA
MFTEPYRGERSFRHGQVKIPHRNSFAKAYEDKHFATSHGDPVGVLHFAIESMGKAQAELAALIGRNRASEILNRVRPLTLEMIRTVSREWNIPIDALAAPYELARAYA